MLVSARRAFTAAALALTLAGCAGGLEEGVGPGLLGGGASSTPANDGFDPREAALGQREHPRIVAAFGGTYVEPELQRYLDTIVSELRPASDRPDLGYRVTVLNSASINAFSLPGGYIYVSRGLLALANDSAEVAAVLAHEMAHITARHAIEREQQATSASIVGQVVGDVVNDPEAGAAALAMTRGRLAQFSRQQELEADLIGIRTAAQAGFDPEAAVSFLRSLERQTELYSRATHQEYDPGRLDIFATHPATPQRILAAEREAAQLAGTGAALRDRDRYLQVINGLAFGDDPREGFVVGRTFTHPELGLTFTLPEGYSLENTPRAVVGFSAAGDIIRFDTVSVGRATGMSEYLRDGAVRGGRVSDVEEFTIDDMPAAQARVSGNGWDFKVVSIRGRGTTVYRFILASRELEPAQESDLLSAARTFRRVSPDDARRIRPQRISIVTAAPGDTVESLAARMDFDDLQVQRFRTLNGLSPSDRVRPGQRMKVVVR